MSPAKSSAAQSTAAKASPAKGEAEALADPQGVRSVQRALDILALLSQERPVVSLRDIVEATGLAKTTAIRLAQTLEQHGLLWAAPNGYLPGPGLWRWAHLVRSSWELPPETRSHLQDLGRRRRETVNLYMRRDIHRVCVAQQESPQPLRHVVHIGDELPLWAGAASKVLLREAPEALLRRVAIGSPYGEGHLERLREWIDEAADRGWAVSHGEREAGLSAVAVPIGGRKGSVVAALSLSGPTVRFPDDVVEQLGNDLQQVAQKITDRGFDHPLGLAN